MCACLAFKYNNFKTCILSPFSLSLLTFSYMSKTSIQTISYCLLMCLCKSMPPFISPYKTNGRCNILLDVHQMEESISSLFFWNNLEKSCLRNHVHWVATYHAIQSVYQTPFIIFCSQLPSQRISIVDLAGCQEAVVVVQQLKHREYMSPACTIFFLADLWTSWRNTREWEMDVHHVWVLQCYLPLTWLNLF